MAMLMANIEKLIRDTLRELARLELQQWQESYEEIERERGRIFLTAFFSRKPPEKTRRRKGG